MNREQFHQQAKRISFLLERAPSYINEKKTIETKENLQNSTLQNDDYDSKLESTRDCDVYGESCDIEKDERNFNLFRKSENNNYISLDRWILKENKNVSLRVTNQKGVEIEENLVYLEHPYIIRQFVSTYLCKQEQNIENESDDDTSTDEIESMIHDMSFSNSNQICDIDEVDYDLPNVKLNNNYSTHDSCKDTMLEWKFSIVYHELWMVPVLYFQVHFLDGKRCSRTTVLEALNVHNLDSGSDIYNQDCIIDTWDFLSEEEHPVTGIPSFFLHPCQTSARLRCMLKSSNEDSRCEEDYSDNLLLMWMTMILPAVKCKITMQNMYFLMNNVLKM